MAISFLVLGNGGHANAVRSWIVPANADCRFSENNHDVQPNEKIVLGVGDLKTRVLLFELFKDQIYNDGIQIMRNVTIDPTAKIGKNVLLNTGCQIDHDCDIGKHCIISPGAILCGNVKLGRGCQIGAGAIILEGTKLDAGTAIPAGSTYHQQTGLRRPVRILREGKISGEAGKKKGTPIAGGAVGFRSHTNL